MYTAVNLAGILGRRRGGSRRFGWGDEGWSVGRGVYHHPSN